MCTVGVPPIMNPIAPEKFVSGGKWTELSVIEPVGPSFDSDAFVSPLSLPRSIPGLDPELEPLGSAPSLLPTVCPFP